MTTVILFIFTLPFSGYAELPYRADSLLKVLPNSSGSDRMGILAELAWIYKTHDPDQSIRYGEEALQLAKKLKNPHYQGEVMLYLGSTYFYLNDYNKAVDYFIQSLKIKEKLKDQKAYAAILNNIGEVYLMMKDHSQALNYFNQALHLFQKLGSEKNSGVAHTNIGRVYYQLGDCRKSIVHIDTALAIVALRNHAAGRAAAFHYKGLVLADSCYEGRNLEAGLGYLREAIRIYIGLGDRYEDCATRIDLGKVLQANGYSERAFKRFTEALLLANQIRSPFLKQECYDGLAKVYEKKGEFRKALNYQLQFSSLKDSLFRIEHGRTISEIQNRYLEEKKEKEHILLKKSAEIQALRLTRQVHLRNFLFIVVILVAFLAIVLFNRYRFKIKTNQLLEEKNRELALLNATKDKFFSIIAHDLKNPFQTLVTVSEMLSRRYHELDEAQKSRIVQTIYHSANLTHNLLENLLLWSISQTGNIPFRPAPLNLSETIARCLALVQLQADKKSIRLINGVDELKKVYGDENMVATILRNLLSNAVKFSPEGTSIEVIATLLNNMVEVRVIDQGIGISKEDQEKLFRIDISQRLIGLSPEKGTGLGLILCREFIEKNGGAIRVESESGKGSIFIFTIPAVAHG